MWQKNIFNCQFHLHARRSPSFSTPSHSFALRPSCGHGGFRSLLFYVNGVLMLHLPSGSYRILDIDFAFCGLTLHDPAMSNCYSLLRAPTGLGNGFAVEPWRAPFLAPDPDKHPSSHPSVNCPYLAAPSRSQPHLRRNPLLDRCHGPPCRL